MLERLQNYREERARAAQQRAAEEVRKEAERVQAEKAVLMGLSDKELMVEAVMALRGLREQHDALTDNVASLQQEVTSLSWGIHELKSS